MRSMTLHACSTATFGRQGYGQTRTGKHPNIDSEERGMAVERLVLACMPRWSQSWADEDAGFRPCHYTWKALPADLA